MLSVLIYYGIPAMLLVALIVATCFGTRIMYLLTMVAFYVAGLINRVTGKKPEDKGYVNASDLLTAATFREKLSEIVGTPEDVAAEEASAKTSLPGTMFFAGLTLKVIFLAKKQVAKRLKKKETVSLVP